MRAILDLKSPVSQLSSNLTTLGYVGNPPAAANTYVNSSNYTVCWIGPEHWWLLAPLEAEKELASRIPRESGDQAVSATLLSDSMAFFSIVGPDAVDVLAIAGPLDAQTIADSKNGVSWTDCFGLKTLVLCLAADQYHLAVDASFAPMFAEYLGKAIGTDLSPIGTPVFVMTDNRHSHPDIDV